MTDDDDPIMISALQHAFFCERQYALIHLEQLWAENRFTAEGEALHERVDTVGHESRRLFRQEYGMGVRSLRYGLTGRCDLVEVRLDMGGRVIEALPVEFKRGGNKEDDRDRVQLCAQALCLEEMLGIAVPRGQLYYRKEHRRSSVEINGDLRQTTIRLIGRIKEIRDAGITPPAVYLKKKCDTCSLVELCMPQSAGSGGKRVDRYIQAQIRLSKEAESS